MNPEFLQALLFKIDSRQGSDLVIMEATLQRSLYQEIHRILLAFFGAMS
jgi:hypothetical protein